MAKKLTTLIKQAVREQKRREAARVREHNAQVRQHQQLQQHNARMQILQRQLEIKEMQMAAVAAIEEKTQDLNDGIASLLDEINSILDVTLRRDDAIDMQKLKQPTEFRPIVIPPNIRHSTDEPGRFQFFGHIQEPSKLSGLIPGARQKHQAALKAAEEAYQNALAAHRIKEQQRQQELEQLTNEYNQEKEQHLLEVESQNTAIDVFIDAYSRGQSDAILAYCTMVLEWSEYSDIFPQQFQLAYDAENKELFIDYELPPSTIVPVMVDYKHIKTRNEIQGKERKSAEIQQLYTKVITSVCLRSIHEVIEADRKHHLESVVFNGYIEDIDPATGNDTKTYFVTVRVPRSEFEQVTLARVDHQACLKKFNGALSTKSLERLGVKPIPIPELPIEDSDVSFVVKVI